MTKAEAIQLIEDTNFEWQDIPSATAKNILKQMVNATGGDSGALVYRALLTQTGTDAPTAVVSENTIGAIVWSYNGVGDYAATLLSAFTIDKTLLFAGARQGIFLDFTRSDDDSLRLRVNNSTVPTDGLLTLMAIEILVYP